MQMDIKSALNFKWISGTGNFKTFLYLEGIFFGKKFEKIQTEVANEVKNLEKKVQPMEFSGDLKIGLVWASYLSIYVCAYEMKMYIRDIAVNFMETI